MDRRVGILAAELYFPKQLINQQLLEETDGCPGKYTNGLGQVSMGICDIAEDINSLALTVTHNLIQRIGLDLKKVGFLEVGTESLVDKSKSTKSVLMQLFDESGNYDVAGIDVKSACYGSTAALFNAINWLESTSCDGRLALVVAADIAIYATKSTQPTGGAGAVALLLGPNAPLVPDPGLRVCCMRHRYDFYKPIMSSVFPEVDGHLSITCYKEALLSCYALYRSKVEKSTGQGPSVLADFLPRSTAAAPFPIDYFCFHSPFCRLVAKSFGWLALEDVKTAKAAGLISMPAAAAGEPTSTCSDLVAKLYPLLENQISPRELDTACLEASKDLFEKRVKPGLLLASKIGNMYTASLYSCLISLCCTVPEEELRGRRILMYAYGSGYTASMFSILVSPHASMSSIFGVNTPASPIERLTLRVPITYEEFQEMIKSRETSVDKAPLEPPFNPNNFFPGTYFLSKIDDNHRRFYNRVPLSRQ
uniref:Hydroxymethylglutaryl-CoA synthase n=1 Tax=Schistocephalus solidus TaxID=70667 RepID=A0A0V0J901_SCHSO